MFSLYTAHPPAAVSSGEFNPGKNCILVGMSRYRYFTPGFNTAKLKGTDIVERKISDVFI